MGNFSEQIWGDSPERRHLDEIVEAHTLMEHGSAGGKLVVVP